MDILSAFKNIRQIFFASEYDNGDAGSAKTIDFARGQYQKVRLTASDGVLTITPPSAPCFCMLRIFQDTVGARPLVFSGLNAAGWWGSSTQPDHNLAINGETLWRGYWSGSTWSHGIVKVGAQ